MKKTKIKTKTRFAPSPTGYLHLGNARTALLNFLFAEKQGGEFILRIDDTDDTRSEDSYKHAIAEDLTWLGVSWGATFSQSGRADTYLAQAETLKSKGLLYPCYESEEELLLLRRTALAAKLPPVYNRAALSLSASERQAKEAAGIKPHWRFKLSQGEAMVSDILLGEVGVKTNSLSDPVLIRADGRFLYTLPSVFDDLDFAITHIIRGDDHLTNSAVQVELAHALGGTPPQFAHHPLMVNEDGQPLSKRFGDFSLRAFRDVGFEAEALVEHLVGKRDNFDFHAQAKHNVRFARSRLEKLNSQTISQMSWAQAQDKLPADISAADWEGLRANLTFIKDAELWHKIIYGNPDLPSQPLEAEFLKTALALLPPPPFDETSWQRWTKALAEASDRRGKALYLPLRLALTGQKSGPEMKNLIGLLGHEKISQRLSI